MIILSFLVSTYVIFCTIPSGDNLTLQTLLFNLGIVVLIYSYTFQSGEGKSVFFLSVLYMVVNCVTYLVQSLAGMSHHCLGHSYISRLSIINQENTNYLLIAETSIVPLIIFILYYWVRQTHFPVSREDFLIISVTVIIDQIFYIILIEVLGAWGILFPILYSCWYNTLNEESVSNIYFKYIAVISYIISFLVYCVNLMS